MDVGLTKRKEVANVEKVRKYLISSRILLYICL